jgi:hypothetical protein
MRKEPVTAMSQLVDTNTQEETTQRFMAYDYLMWHLGGRPKGRGAKAIGERVGVGYRDIERVIEDAFQKCRQRLPNREG